VSEQTKPNKFEIRRAKRNARLRSWRARNPELVKAARLRQSERAKQKKLNAVSNETPPKPQP
jgi:hypothetical protein